MNTSTRTLLALTAAASLVALPACGSSGSASSGSSSDASKKVTVVTAFYPFQYVSQQVAGDAAEVTSLTAPGAEPHDLELTPKQVAQLGEADVVVYEKGFQASVDKAVEQAAPKHVVDVANVVQMQPASGIDEETGKPATGNDPHSWLLPSNMQKIGAAVADQLKQVRGDQAASFDANAKRLDGELTALDSSFRTGLQHCQRKDFITSHAAFGYLAKAYGLNQIGISGLSPDEEPSPARVAEVQKLAKAKGVTTIFYETLVSPAQAKAIAGDMGLKTDVLDPIEGITKESRGSDYIAVQKSNLLALQKANGCN